MTGTLFLVATPIGNLGDVSARAIETLQKVDLIACEDTRRTGRLVNHLGIEKKRLVSYHDHNERERASQLAQQLSDGKSVALVSDAGTPGIADPGFRIVAEAIEIGAPVVVIPGPAAFVSALVASGLPTDSFYFGGFLPSKRNARRKRLEEVSSIPSTLIFYESPKRIVAALKDCLFILGNRNAAVAREMTKLHEEFLRGSLDELVRLLAASTVKGEIVLVISGQSNDPESAGKDEIIARLEELESSGMEKKEAIKLAAKEFGMTKSDLYMIDVENRK